MMIFAGLVLIVIGLVLWFQSVADIDRMQEFPASPVRVRPSVPASQATIIGANGRVIAPEGVDTWSETRSGYELWDRLCNPNPRTIGKQDGFDWYLQDVAGTPVTDEQANAISGYYAEPHVPYRQQYGYEE